MSSMSFLDKVIAWTSGVMKRVNVLVDRFVPENIHQDLSDLRRARIMVMFCLISQLFFVITGVKWLSLGYMPLFWNVLATQILILGGLAFFRLSHSLTLTGQINVAILSSYFGVYIYLTGGLDSFAIGWILLMPILAVIMSGPLSVVFWIGVMIVEIIVFHSWTQAGTVMDIMALEGDELLSFRRSDLLRQLAAITVSVIVIEGQRRSVSKEQSAAMEQQMLAVEEQERAKVALEEQSPGTYIKHISTLKNGLWILELEADFQKEKLLWKLREFISVG